MKFKIIGLLCLIGSSAFAQKEVNLSTLLHETADADTAPRWPDPYYKEMMSSSYNRHSLSPDQPGWFANGDWSQYIRTEIIDGHQEAVMLDADGPGAIVRFWLTTFKRNGVLRVYFDGQTSPEIIIPAYDLMKSGLDLGLALLEPHSSYEPKEKDGSTLYLPMPYAKHCKITWGDHDPDNQPRYYQVNYRSYRPGTKVKTFTKKQLTTLSSLASTVNDRLLHPDNNVNGKQVQLNGTIKPGQELSAQLPEGAAAVHCLTIEVKTERPEDDEQALRSTVLKLEFDGEQTVWCPISDFSGSGVGGKPLQSWYRTVTQDGKIICRWLMPYQKNGKISLLNTGSTRVSVSLTATRGDWKWDKNSMYFHADWKNETNVQIRKTEEDKPTSWLFNSIKGKGIFLGDTFAVYNHMHKWYGEGDQKIWTDDSVFPAEFGTGTEDYYNTSWAPVILYQTLFANARADSFGHNPFTRTRNLDRLPFENSFRYSLETLGWENGTVDFAATTYWYGFKGAKSDAAARQTQPKSLIP